MKVIEGVLVLDQQERSEKLIEEFGRQILVPGIDEEGQQNISKKKICIIGLGALGTVASQYLVRAGVGEIHIIDHDKIEKSNLHRQINYDKNDIGKSKSDTSKHKLKYINDLTIINEYSSSFESFIKKNPNNNFDLIFDCTDNHHNKIFSSKYSKVNKVSFVSISINSSEGIYFAQNNEENNASCFECLFPKADQNHRCLNSAMIGPVAGFVTSFACMKIIFALAKIKTQLKSEINLIDLLTSDINKLQLDNKDCPH